MLLSSDNQKVKLARKLKDKKERDKTSQFIVEGARQLGEAIKSGADIDFILNLENTGEELLAIAKSLNIENNEIDEKTLRSISDTETPQGILAVVNKHNFTFEDITKDNNPLVVVCDGIQDPGNLGAIIRSAAAAGASGVIISDDSVDVYNPKTVRSTGGALFKIPVLPEADIQNTISLLKEKGIKVLGADPRSSKSIYEAHFARPLAIVIGNEGNGIKENILSLCDEKVMIPMRDDVESLNAAVSASVILFEAVRQGLL